MHDLSLARAVALQSCRFRPGRFGDVPPLQHNLSARQCASEFAGCLSYQGPKTGLESENRVLLWRIDWQRSNTDLWRTTIEHSFSAPVTSLYALPPECTPRGRVLLVPKVRSSLDTYSEGFNTKCVGRMLMGSK